MSEKLVVESLTKVFGRNPERALAMLDAGKGKSEIRDETGLVVGVQDASFTVREGEIFVVMGLSGSGKSTLIRMLNRLIDPTSGAVRIDGRDVAAMSKAELIALRRRDMAMVFQSFALLPHLTVRENAEFGLDVAGMPAAERRERALEALGKVGLGAYADSYPHELSGGQQQRVGLARALALDPGLLLMDEAFSALDPLIRTEMQDELLRLQAESARTVIFISHDLDEAFRIADRIAIMEDGRIVQVATPDEIVRAPADDYVSAFFKGVDVTKVLRAGDIVEDSAFVVDRGTVLGALHRRLAEGERPFAYVCDEEGRFLGVVAAETVKSALDDGAGLDDAMMPAVEAVPADTPVEELLGVVAESPFPVPVVDANRAFRGIVSRRALLGVLDRGRP